MNAQWNNGPMPNFPRRPRESNGRFERLAAEMPRAIAAKRSAAGSPDRTTQSTAFQRWVERRPAVAVGLAIVVGVLVGIWVKRR